MNAGSLSYTSKCETSGGGRQMGQNCCQLLLNTLLRQGTAIASFALNLMELIFIKSVPKFFGG